MRTKRILILMATGAFLGLVVIAGGVGARPPADESTVERGVATGSIASLLVNYQGRLLDPSTGNPKPNDTYTMVFSIYDVSAAGTALWTEANSVEVTDGLFSTILGNVEPLSLNIFTGQDLWLGIKVGADAETSPRQQLLPMPYALYAANADLLDGLDSSAFGDITAVAAGTGLSGGGTSGAVTVSVDTTYLQRRVTGTCASGSAIRVVNADGTVTCEADDDTTYTEGAGLSLAGTTFSVNFAGSGAATTVARSDHDHSGDYAFADHNHWGETWNGPGTGLTLAGGTIGLTSHGSSETGVYSEAEDDGVGVQGVSKNSTGVWGTSSLGTGVWGQSDSGDGVYGFSKDGYGVHGASATNYGGHFSSEAGIALYADGAATVTGDLTVGGSLIGGNHTHSTLPIAYGFVNEDGTLASGTSNVGTRWDATYSRYQITISRYSYFWTGYSTVVTLASGKCAQPCGVETASVSGKLLVFIYDNTGAKVQCPFQFVTFQP